jgi:hypothetical protein
MAKEYDKIFKENIEAIYLSLSEKVLNFRPLKIADINLDLQRTIERHPDFLTKVQEPDVDEVFLLHLEIQKADDSEMLYRMYEYHALMLRKFKIRIVQIVIYIGEGESKMNNVLEMGDNRFSYQLFSIQSISYRTFLESDKPEELLLAILANLEGQSAETVIEKVLNKAKYHINETFSRDKFVVHLEVLAGMRNFSVPFKTILNKIMPIEIKLEETYLFKKGEEKGEKRGEKRGEKKNRDRVILALYNKGKLSIEDIADAAEVSVEYVKELVKNIKM